MILNEALHAVLLAALVADAISAQKEWIRANPGQVFGPSILSLIGRGPSLIGKGTGNARGATLFVNKGDGWVVSQFDPGAQEQGRGG